MSGSCLDLKSRLGLVSEDLEVGSAGMADEPFRRAGASLPDYQNRRGQAS